MKAEGGRMKEKHNDDEHAFILHPSSFRLAFQTLRRVINPMMATKIVAPMIDQMMGNVVSPILSVYSSGSFNWRASHMPMIAPMKPSAMETRQPPREKPLMACPNAPQIPATRSRINKSIQVIGTPPTKDEFGFQNTGLRRK
jgi:hypothetical protein